MKTLNEVTSEIIKDYKLGFSSQEVQNKYGDFGLFIISEFGKQNIEAFHLIISSWNEDNLEYEKDLLKEKIFKSYINGLSEEDIKNLYGEYGILYLKKVKELLIKFVPKF